MAGKNEYIVDNEDKGFSGIRKSARLIWNQESNSNKKTGKILRNLVMEPSREWIQHCGRNLSGNYVTLRHYTRGGTGERTATWKIALPEKASYDVYFYLDKVNNIWRRTNKSADYNFLVYHDTVWKKLTASSEDAGMDGITWELFPSPRSARIDLTIKPLGTWCFADAVNGCWMSDGGGTRDGLWLLWWSVVGCRLSLLFVLCSFVLALGLGSWFWLPACLPAGKPAGEAGLWLLSIGYSIYESINQQIEK